MTRTLTQAPSLAGASIASNDEIWIWDVTAAGLFKTTRAELIGGTITDGGTIATGGFTLTVPATGTAALLATAQTFTAAQIIDVASGNPLTLRIAAGTHWTFDGTIANGYRLAMTAIDNGAGSGRYVLLDQNNNGSTPAAGFVRMTSRTGTSYRVWPDGSGNLRIHTADPTNANDAAGTVVGAQTSSLDTKNVLGEAAPIVDVLAAVRQGAEAVRRFVYKSGSFNGEEFSGVVVDYSPRYGMDKDEEHPAGKSLNVITAIGDLLMAVANLTERVEALERG